MIWTEREKSDTLTERWVEDGDSHSSKIYYIVSHISENRLISRGSKLYI